MDIINNQDHYTITVGFYLENFRRKYKGHATCKYCGQGGTTNNKASEKGAREWAVKSVIHASNCAVVTVP